MLGDSERPADHRPVGAGVGMRRLPDGPGGNAGLALGVLERVRFDAVAVALEASRGAVDEGGVRKPRVDDLAPHRVRQRDVRADLETEPAVSPLRRGGPARVHGEEPRPAAHPFQDVMEEDRVRLAGVRAPEEDDVRLLDLAVGAGASPSSEHRRQTDDAGRVSGPVTAIDVVRTEDDARQLLRQEVDLVGGPGAAEDADGVRPRRADRALQRRGRQVERLVPSRWTKFVVLADERLGQSQITCLHGGSRWATVGKKRASICLSKTPSTSPREERDARHRLSRRQAGRAQRASGTTSPALLRLPNGDDRLLLARFLGGSPLEEETPGEHEDAECSSSRLTRVRREWITDRSAAARDQATSLLDPRSKCRLSRRRGGTSYQARRWLANSQELMTASTSNAPSPQRPPRWRPAGTL